MMPPLYTPVNISPLSFRLGFDSGVLSLGSCFADEIGLRLQRDGFHVDQNPFGTLYNPASVASALRRLVDDKEVAESDLVYHDGLWHSWYHHGSFSRPSVAETLHACNSRIHQAHAALLEADLLVVTFGTAWVFERDDEHRGTQVVANCHKMPAATFTRRRMTVDEIVTCWQPLLQGLAAVNANLNVLFTVSPIRHMADGAHGNQLSKSTLLLAVDRLSTSSFQLSTTYFPAYEIVLDELRDYRFYAPDMAHPSSLAVDIVYDRFCQSCMAPATMQQAHNNAKQLKRQQHIPLHKQTQQS